MRLSGLRGVPARTIRLLKTAIQPLQKKQISLYAGSNTSGGSAVQIPRKETFSRTKTV